MMPSQHVFVPPVMVARALLVLVLHVRLRRSRLLVETRFALAVKQASSTTRTTRMTALRISVRLVALGIRTRQQVRVALMLKLAVFVIPGMKEGTVPLARHVNCVHSETSKLLRVTQTVEHVQTLSNRVMIV